MTVEGDLLNLPKPDEWLGSKHKPMGASLLPQGYRLEGRLASNLVPRVGRAKTKTQRNYPGLRGWLAGSKL